MGKLYQRMKGFMVDKITDSDMYSKTILLTYKGKGSFQTFIGGLVSLITFAIMASFTFTVIKNLFINNKITANKNSLQMDLITDKTKFFVGEQGLRFSVLIIGNDGMPLDPDFYTIKFNNFRPIAEYYDSDYPVYEYVQLETILCNQSDFPKSTDVKYHNSIESGTCLLDNNYYLAGKNLGLANSYLDISIGI